MAEGRLSDAPAPEVNLSGFDILPGIIDLHGDAFERHIAPRPSAPFPLRLGLAGTDRDAAAHGVTTAWMAQSWSWEDGHRGPDYAEDFLAAHRAYRDRCLTDLRVQIRCEIYTVDTVERLLAAIRAYGIDYVIFNDHLSEALTLVETRPSDIALWAHKSGRSPEAHLDLIRGTHTRKEDVPEFLVALARAFSDLGVRFGSHDDGDAATRAHYAGLGARICEFPTTVEAARAAREAGDPVLMGAPNVVRGGSQSGNVSAVELIREGLCDALVSDYHYPTLAQAALTLVDARLADLPAAWAMISNTPARIMGLEDRGRIAPGLRADLCILNRETRMVEGTLAGGRWSHLSGDLARRLTAAATARGSLVA